MQIIYPQQPHAPSRTQPRRARQRLFGLGAALMLSLGALSPAWAQLPPTQPAPVPGADEAAAQSGVSGSGATTGAGSDPISATTMMKATGTSASSTGTGGKKGKAAKKAKAAKNNRNAKPIAGSIPPWEGRRVLLLLPLKLGAGFNADRAFGQAILSRAEARLQASLDATGKFSVIRAHRFSPLIQRALLEKRLTEAQAESAIKEPVDLPAATAFLSQFTFDQVPLIAQFTLEEVRGGGIAARPTVQAQVAGRLYELNNPVALKAPVLTSDPVEKGRNNIERYLDAAGEAFGDVAAEFVAPLEDIVLPRVEPAAAPSSTPDPATASNGVPAVTNATPQADTPAATPAQPVPDNSMGTGAGDAGTAPVTDPAMAPGTEPAPDTDPAPATEPAVAPGGGGVAPGTEPPAPAP